MRVVLADIEQGALDQAVDELTRQRHDVLGVRTDVSSPESVEDLARAASDAFGNIHVLFNNAASALSSSTSGLATRSTRWSARASTTS